MIMTDEKLKNKTFVFYTENRYESHAPIELAQRGYKIIMNKIVENADLFISMGIQSSFRMYKDMKDYEKLFDVTLKGKTIHTFLDLPYWRLKDKIWKGYYDNYKRILESSDFIIGISNESLKDLKSEWGLIGKRHFNYFMDKDIDEFKDIKVEKREQIISIGRFAQNKKFEQVLEALNLINYTGDYIIIGPSDGGYAEKYKNLYRELADKYKINLKIKVNIPYKEVITELKRSKLCIVPSIFEGQGDVSFESIWCDTEFIGANLPVKREFHKNTIILCKPDNIVDLSKVIIRVLNGELKTDFELAKKQIENCRIKPCVDEFIKYLINEVYNDEPKTKSSKDDRYIAK